MSPLTFTPAREQDAALLVQLYDAAFRADYERYGECPAYGRTVEQMQGSIRRFPKLIIRLYSSAFNGNCFLLFYCWFCFFLWYK